ncbi:MAG: FAD-linked oxidase [Rhodobacterales bacterium]|nr:MAG: FAD-linked oxidase [Rhodobacterales bacterium]
MWKHDVIAGWGRVLKREGEFARPERAAHLARVMTELPGPAFGNRRSYGDAPLPAGEDGRGIDMTRMDKILSFDAETGVLEAEAGLTLGEITRIFAPRGWIPAVLPGTGFATLGGAIAQDVHGKNHHGAGSFGQHVLAVTLLQPGGKRVVATPETAPGLFRATMGGIGQTGVIEAAKIQMIPTPGETMRVTETRIDGFDAFLDALDSSTATYTVGWIDGTAKGEALGRGILEEAELDAAPRKRRAKDRTVPFNAPHFALSAPIVRLFNAAYFRRVPKAGRSRIRSIEQALFPLDAIHEWNRLYGKRGFYQFQCVVPVDQAEVLRQMLVEISESGACSPLAVIKRMGPGRAGPLSFPMEGYTLAIDFPARAAARELIQLLEVMTQNAGGRLYLAKDALAGSEMIKAMYPEWEIWAKEAAKADPEGRLVTDMVARLKLREMGA